MSFRPAALVLFLLAAALAACDGGGAGNGGGGGVTVSASKIALVTVYYPPAGENPPRRGGNVTVVVRTASGVSPSRVDLVVPESMKDIEAQLLRPVQGGALVVIVWGGGATPGRAALRVIVRGETVSVPIDFVAPTGLSTLDSSPMDAITDFRFSALPILPGTTGTMVVTLGVASANEALALTLAPTSAAAGATLASPVTIAAGTAAATTVPVTLRMGASVAPGTVDTLLIHVTRPDGALVSSGEIAVRTTAAPSSSTMIQHVPHDRSLWPYADTTGIRNVYRWGDVSFRSTRFRTIALRADGRVFVFFGGDTTRNVSPPEGFRAIAIGGGGALDPLGAIRDATGGGNVVAHVPSWGKATTVGGGGFPDRGYDQNYRTIVGYADGWVRDLTQVGGVGPLGSARLPSAPVVASAGHVSIVAMTADGAVYGWGSNLYGMIGNGGPPEQTVAAATQVAGLPPMARIVIGPFSVTGTDRVGVRWGWGVLPNTPATAGCTFVGGNGERRCPAPVRLP